MCLWSWVMLPGTLYTPDSYHTRVLLTVRGSVGQQKFARFAARDQRWIGYLNLLICTFSLIQPYPYIRGQSYCGGSPPDASW